MYSIAVLRVSTLESFLLDGSVGTCFLRFVKPSLTSLTLFLSRSLRRNTEACSFFVQCGVRHRDLCFLDFWGRLGRSGLAAGGRGDVEREDEVDGAGE